MATFTPWWMFSIKWLIWYLTKQIWKMQWRNSKHCGIHFLKHRCSSIFLLFNTFLFLSGNSVQILLLNIETRIFLLQLIQYQPNIPQLLYDGHWQNAHGKSVTRKEEFQTLAKFLLLIRENNYFEVNFKIITWKKNIQARQLYSLKLQMLLDPKGKALCTKLLNSLDNILSADKTQ